jgi:hypothetical protein
MLRPAALAAGLLWTCCMAASAQTPNPVIQHYRAYQAALDANDLTTAEREAASALTASEARDGDGGRTAVLAFNLATVRFVGGNAAGALEPGRRALALSQQRGAEASGVSPAFAQLVVGRAELAAGEAGAAEHLGQALEAAQQERIAPEEIFDGARELAAWTLRNERYEESARAWSIAANYAEGSRLPPAHARGIALTGSAAALILGEIAGRQRRIPADVARDAYGTLIQALNTMATLPGLDPDGAVTPVMRNYAEALAWRAALRAKLRTDGQDIPVVQETQGDGADGLNEVRVPRSAGQLPRCLVRIRVRDNERLYPEDAVMDGRLAGVAVLFRINEAGEIEDVEALASVGGAEFGEHAEQRRAWRIERRDDSPTNCRMAMTVIQSISFQLG